MDIHIYYHDTDAGGVVYYANYLKFLEEARTEYLDSRGACVADLAAKGYLFAVRECNVRYKAPARYGDTVTCTAELKNMTAAQIVFYQAVRDKTSGRLLVEADVSLVCLNAQFRPTQIPDDVRNVLVDG